MIDFVIGNDLGPLVLCAVLVAAFVLGNWLIGPIVRRRDPRLPTPIWPSVAVAGFAVGAMLVFAWLMGLLDDRDISAPVAPCGTSWVA